MHNYSISSYKMAYQKPILEPECFQKNVETQPIKEKVINMMNTMEEPIDNEGYRLVNNIFEGTSYDSLKLMKGNASEYSQNQIDPEKELEILQACNKLFVQLNSLLNTTMKMKGKNCREEYLEI